MKHIKDGVGRANHRRVKNRRRIWFIGVWQQESGKGPRLADGAAYCVPDLPPHTLSPVRGRNRRVGGVSVPQIYCALFPSHRPTCIRVDRVPKGRPNQKKSPKSNLEAPSPTLTEAPTVETNEFYSKVLFNFKRERASSYLGPRCHPNAYTIFLSSSTNC